MFEKEAEEYATKKIGDFKPFQEDKESEWVSCCEDFQKGAEFGYNKAKEWNELKTKRPQLRTKVLWLIDKQLWLGELLESRIDFGEWELDSVLFNDYEISWKEIVLP